ncbi:MAG: hypothetical protein ACRC8P_00570 [Spiroplasma sp.]
MIIIELILNYHEINAKEIQASFNDFFILHKEYLPSKYFNLYKENKQKTRLKQQLINLTVSNANHNNGLKKRNELTFRKVNKETFYKVVNEVFLFDNFNSLCETFLFLKKYQFLNNLYNKFFNNKIKLLCFICTNEDANLLCFDSNKVKTIKEAIFKVDGICKFCLEKELGKEIQNV